MCLKKDRRTNTMTMTLQPYQASQRIHSELGWKDEREPAKGGPCHKTL